MNRLTRLGLNISSLGFGSAPIGNLYQTIPEAEAAAAIQAALENGVTVFDTAPLYGAGLAERRLGEVLRGMPRSRYTLQSKVGRVLQDGGLHFDLSSSGLERSLEGSLKRLQVDSLDLVLLHDPDAHETAAMRSALPTLLAWREQGIVRGVGVGMNQWEMPQRFLEHFDLDVVMLAGRYTLLEQTALGFLNQCAAQDVAVMAAGVFNSGILATGATPTARYQYQHAPPTILEQTKKLEALCRLHNVPLAAAAVQFVLRHPAVVCAVLGSSSRAETLEHGVFVSQPIADSFWSELKNLALIKGDCP